MVWRDPDDQIEEIEATWEEFSQFNKESFRFLTFSEFDQLEIASVYYIEQNVPPYGSTERDFVPLNFLSSLFLHSHKGNKSYTLLRKSHYEISQNKNVLHFA